MPSYDSFAAVYDRIMGDRTAEVMRFRKLISARCPQAKSVLELGCGTGSLTSMLTKWYSCTGVDRSSGMVRIARKKAPRAEFHVGDITSFELGERFDAIICAFDTMNHLPSFKAWEAAFERASAHLNPGGVYLFDVNTEYKLDRFATERSFSERMDEDVTSVIDAVKKGPGKFVLRVSAFVRERGSRFVLHDLIVPELTFPTATIRKALAKHFAFIATYDPDRSRPSASTEELYFICRSPKAAKASAPAASSKGSR